MNVKHLAIKVTAIGLVFSSSVFAEYDPSFSTCEILRDGDSVAVNSGETFCIKTTEEYLKVINLNLQSSTLVTDLTDEFTDLSFGESTNSHGSGFHISANSDSIITIAHDHVIVTALNNDRSPATKAIEEALERTKRFRWFSRAGRGWGENALKAAIDDQDRKNYEAYRRKRDKADDAAARARAYSKSDLNSRRDNAPTDRIGGR